MAEWTAVAIREGLLKRIEEKAERLGYTKSRVVNKALEFLLLMGYFDYANPYEWLEAKVEEVCGEMEEDIEEVSTEMEGTEAKRGEKKEEPKEERIEEREERIGIDVPLWGEETQPQGKENQSQPNDENDDDWVITF